MVPYLTAKQHDGEWIYRGVTLLLLGNLLLGRFLIIGPSGLPTTIALLACVLALLLLSPGLRRLLRRHRALLALARYAPWCALTMVSNWYRPYTVLPKTVVVLILLSGLVMDGWLHARFVVPPALSLWILVAGLAVSDGVLRRTTRYFLVVGLTDALAPDRLLGYRPVPGRKTRVTGRYDGRNIYTVTYRVDRLSRRVVVDSTWARKPHKHAIFMGCSFVFGSAVEDWETLPSHFATLTSDYAVYNYGCMGYGTQQVYAKLASRTLPQEVPENSGLLIYCLHPQHIARTIGSYWTLSWGRGFPRYELSGDSLRLTGSFENCQKPKVTLFDLLRKSPTLNRLAMVGDRIVRRRLSPRLAVRLIQEAASEYARQFDGKYLVSVWPNRDPRTPDVVRALRGTGVRVVDLASLGVPALSPEYQVPHDNHPTGAYYRLAARALIRALQAE
jgi:hypothetical protein